MSNTSECVNAAFKALKEKYGENFKIEDGEEYVFRLKNCALYIGLEDGTLSVKFIGGEVIPLDIGCDMYTEEE